MDRSQQRYLVASMGGHAILFVVLLFGAAFFEHRKPDTEVPNIRFVSADVVDIVLAGGGGNSNLPDTDEAPAPAGGPIAEPPPPVPDPPAPLPDPPKPEPRPPAPQPKPPEPEPEPVKPVVKPPVKKPDTKPVKPADKPKPVPEPRPAPEPPKPAPKKPEIDLDLNKVVVRNPADSQERKRKEKEAADRRAQEKAEREALEKWNREVQARRDGLAASAKNSSALLGTGFASDKGVKIEVGGPGGAAYANYLAVVRKHYDSAWRLSPSLGDQDQTAEVSVTILRSGEILNARISKRSGNAALDKSVESALAQVRRLPPFPETSTDAQRTVTILFNLKAKRSSG